MANDSIYKGVAKSAYLAHYRTKGSKNGISTTKGYQAVGRRARGRLSADGRYIYDTSTGRKYTANGSAGMGSGHRYELNEDSAKKSGVNMKMARNAINSMNKGADNNWQQEANYARLKEMRGDAHKSSPQNSVGVSKNKWQQEAESARNRAIENKGTNGKRVYGNLNQAKAGNTSSGTSGSGTVEEPGYDERSFVLGTASKDPISVRAEKEQYDRWFGKKVRGVARPYMDYDAKYNPNLLEVFSKGWHTPRTSPAYDATVRKAEKDAMNAKVASASSKGTKNNWQDQSNLERWKDQNRKNIAKNKAKAKYKALAKKGSKNNWQQKAAKAASKK